MSETGAAADPSVNWEYCGMILARHEKAETGDIPRRFLSSAGETLLQRSKRWLVQKHGAVRQLLEPLKYNSGTARDFFLTKGIEGVLVV